jgi:hypothetical protein
MFHHQMVKNVEVIWEQVQELIYIRVIKIKQHQHHILYLLYSI